jgi:hypothetical protein
MEPSSAQDCVDFVDAYTAANTAICCSSHASGIARISSSSCIPLGCRLSRINRFRRLKIRYEHWADIHLAFLQLGCALISLRFLG